MSRIVSSISGTNFAGYDSQRHSFVSMAALAHVLQDRKGGIGTSIVGAINNSPYTQLKKLRDWAGVRSNVSHLGQVYEAINRTPYIQPTSGGSNVLLPEDDPNYIPLAYPIRLPAAVEWLWLDQWYKPRANIGWGTGFNESSYTSNRAAAGSTGVLAFRGPAVWTFWAVDYWNRRIGPKPADREKTWTASFNETTGVINMVSTGNWNWSFNPNIDLNAEYLYLNTAISDMYQYRIGSGDVILEQVAAALGEQPDSGYYPMIPTIINNHSISKNSPDLLKQAEKVFKKASGTKLSKLLGEIDGNSSAGDIDLSMVFVGIAANSPKRYCKEYIYRYCQGLRQRAGNPTGALTVKVGNDTPYPGGWASESGYGMVFNSMQETVGTGLRTPGSVVKSLVWEIVAEEARLHWQVSASEWRTMTIARGVAQLTGLPGATGQVALWHVVNNMGDCPFIFPLHEPTLKLMSRLDAIEVTQEAMNLLVGSYTLINTSSLLGGILFFVAGVLLVAFPPGAAGIGLLGTNAAVGASLGLVGSAAVIAGAVINAVAALIVLKIITKVSTVVFGEKIGQIIGAVVGFVAVTVGTGMMNGENLSSIWSSLGSAQNLLALTNSVGSGISGYVSAAIQDLQSDMAAQSKIYDDQIQKIQKNYADEFGYGNRVFDPMSLTSATSGNYMETSQEFLTRTLLTGSDIADISLGMIGSFTDLTISSDLPGTY